MKRRRQHNHFPILSTFDIGGDVVACVMKPIMGDPFETTASSFKRLLEMARESSEMQARIFRGFDAILIFI